MLARILRKSNFHSSLKVERKQITMEWWIDNQKVFHLFNIILFGNKKDWGTDAFYHLEEP